MGITRVILAIVSVLFGLVLTAPIFVLGLPFLFVALLTRVFSHFLEPRTVPWQEIIEYDPTFGWKPKGNLNTYGLADEKFRLTTGSDGWRGKTNIQESDVVVFGDSFAFGYGVDDHAFFADQSLNVGIKAIGSVGYNMVQSVLWMERLSFQLRGKLVIWFIYHGNDLYENLQPNLDRYRLPFIREVNGSGQWEIITSHIRPDRWPNSSERRYYDRLAEICCPTFLSRRVYSACEFLIGRGNSICNGEGAKLVVMTIPDITQMRPDGLELLRSLSPDRKSFDPDLPDKKIREMCEKQTVPFVALKDHMDASYFKVQDCHWNDRGNKRVAEIICDLYHEYFPKK